MKKILSLFLAFTLIFCMIPFGVLAEETEDISSYFSFSKWNNNTGWIITKCNTSISGDITIPSEYNGLPVLAIKGGAFNACNSLTSVTIPDSVTEIDQTIPFRTCTALTTINIPASLTSIEGNIAMQCSALAEINIDSNNPVYCSVDGVMFNKDKTELLFYPGHKADLSYTIPDTVITIGKNAFMDSDVLTELIIPDSVTTISDYAFYDSYALIERAFEKITIGNGVKTIGTDAFRSCNKITQVNITDITAWCNIDFATISSNPMWDDAIHLQAEKDLYLNGELLTDLVIPNTVTEINPWVFSNCRSIKSVTIPSSVTSIGESAFRNCIGLETVNLSKGLLNIGSQVFYDCRALTSVVIPNGVTTIGSSTFGDCFALTSVTIPESVTSIGSSTFYFCSKMERVDIQSLEAWCNISFGAITANPLNCGGNLYINGVLATKITIPDTITSIKDYAFYGYTALTAVTIPDSVKSIGQQAFDKTSLTEVTIPDSVTSIGSSAFANCTALTTAYISENITGISNSLFNNCTSLTEVNIPKGITSIGNYAFGGTKITEAVIPNGVISVGNYAFSNCTKLATVTIPDSVTSLGEYIFYSCFSLATITIPESITSIPYYAFAYCNSLKEITIPTSVTSIGSYAFAGTVLRTVTIPESVTSIGSYAFSGCNYMTAVTIPDSITSIPNYAFSNCRLLTEVTIPDSVTSIGNYAFYNTALEAVAIPDGVKSIGQYAFANTKITEVVIPDSLTSIAQYTFLGCTVLERVYIPKAVTVINTKAFYDCAGIKCVYYEGTAEEWTAINFTTGNESLTGAVIYFNCMSIPMEITVTQLPEKVEYIEKTEELDLTGGILTIYYKNGETEELDLTAVTVTGFDNTVLGEQTLTVEHYGLSAEFTVNIIYRPTMLIAVSKLPDKVKYNFGEVLDLTGGEIVVCYTNGTYETKEITADMISGLDLEPGFKTLTVSYNGTETHFSIFVYRNPDLDHNGMVSATDIAILRKSVMASDEAEELDLNVDGSLDVLDLVYIKKVAS